MIHQFKQNRFRSVDAVNKRAVARKPVNMPRGKELSEYERGLIDAYADQNMRPTEIAKKLNRSVHVVMNYLENPAEYGTKRRSGRPRTLSERDERAVFRVASNSGTSIPKIKALVGVKASRWTIWRAIKRNPNLKRAKLLTGPKLTQNHKNARLEWARLRIEERTDWTCIVFSDEKKFNLDGPDGYTYYWHDLRKEPKTRYSRIQGGGGVMIWGCMAYGGVRWTEVSGNINAVAYLQEVLDIHLSPFGEELGGPKWVFQDDNASIHRGASKIPSFHQRIPRQLLWPSRSPDLNPMENVWGLIVRDVYVDGRQYETLADLRRAINLAFDRIDMQNVQTLVDSMPNRVFKVVQKNGGRTEY